MSTATSITFAAFERLPGQPGKRELVDGEVLEMPPPRFRHTKIAQRLYDLLRHANPGERALPEAGYRLGGGWVQPDVSVAWPGQPIENGYLTGAPELAVEVLSPGNTASQMQRKLTLYFAEGAKEVWVVDPDKRWMAVYQQSEGVVRRIAVQDSFRAESFGADVELRQIFAEDNG